MKTTDLIANFLRTKTASLSNRFLLDGVLSLGIGAATLAVQFIFFWLFCLWVSFRWFSVDWNPSIAASLISIALVLLQFAIYGFYGDYFSAPETASQSAGPSRLLFGGFLLIGPRRLMEAFETPGKIQRLSSIDFKNCANVLERMMKAHDWVAWEEIQEAVFPRPTAARTVEQLRLFPGVILKPSITPSVKLTASLRVEIADYCRKHKATDGA